MILLDTDILIDFVRGHAGCRAWLLSVSAQRVAIPLFVAMELYAGCRNKQEILLIERQLAPYQMVWLDEAGAISMVPQFANAYLSHATGILDSLIAATAIYHGVPLHTFNVKHFSAFPTLKTVQPYVH